MSVLIENEWPARRAMTWVLTTAKILIDNFRKSLISLQEINKTIRLLHRETLICVFITVKPSQVRVKPEST
jgi:hypothetical protein